MGGFFGAASNNDCVTDVFFGTDYHSHLGTRRGGMTSWSEEHGFQRNIHSIENSPFRTKFENDVVNMRGKLCIGCISDTDPQPILVRSKLGIYAVCIQGRSEKSLCILRHIKSHFLGGKADAVEYPFLSSSVREATATVSRLSHSLSRKWDILPIKSLHLAK